MNVHGISIIMTVQVEVCHRGTIDLLILQIIWTQIRREQSDEGYLGAVWSAGFQGFPSLFFENGVNLIEWPAPFI